jgi:hypothetical protein
LIFPESCMNAVTFLLDNFLVFFKFSQKQIRIGRIREWKKRKWKNKRMEEKKMEEKENRRKEYGIKE